MPNYFNLAKRDFTMEIKQLNRVNVNADNWILNIPALQLLTGMWVYLDTMASDKQEGLAVASIARDVGSSSTNRSSDIMH